MSVSVETSADVLHFGPPRTLISTPVLNLIDGRPHYDVTRDGLRYLLRQPAAAKQPPIGVIINWPEQLKGPAAISAGAVRQ